MIVKMIFFYFLSQNLQKNTFKTHLDNFTKEIIKNLLFVFNIGDPNCQNESLFCLLYHLQRQFYFIYHTIKKEIFLNQVKVYKNENTY